MRDLIAIMLVILAMFAVIKGANYWKVRSERKRYLDYSTTRFNNYSRK
jgi:hypothetical protein